MRALRAADAPLLYALHVAAFEPAQVWSLESLREVADQTTALGFIIPDTAFILGRSIFEEAELLTLAVHPSARRQGQARALLTRLCAACRDLGAEAMTLEVAAPNLAAQALYKSMDFKEIGRRANYYPGGVTGLVYKKRL